ncbi:MAG TPA: AI-2E family transporter [Alphaproteobacteria bacterium]|nr:AI-2E family transporter [Alphaproteobacteria bacterium]
MARGALKIRRNDGGAGGSALETVVVAATVIAALYLGRAIAIPIAIAILISFSLGPPVGWLGHRLGRITAILAVVLPALLGIIAFAYVVTTEVGRLAINIPAYQTNIETKVRGVADALPSRAMLDRGTAFLRKLRAHTQPAANTPSTSRGNKAHDAGVPATNPGKPLPVEIQNPDPTPVDLLQTVLGPLVGPIADTALVILFVIFFLAEKEALRDRLIRLAGVRDLHRTTMAMDEAGKRVSRYLLMQTLVNSAFGVVIASGLYALGLPNAALWGAIAAMLRFIPYLGTIGASVLPLALAFAVDPGWTMLFGTAGLFLGLEMLTGNVVEPLLYGSSTGLSAIALVISAIFWTWLWGPIGLLLATPLTVCIAVVGRYVPQLAFLDVLLGNQTPLRPEEAFYQRLLAGHPDEAMSQAEEAIRTQPLAEFLDQVALPALILAERDRVRGELEDEHAQQVADGVKEVLSRLQPPRAKPKEPRLGGPVTISDHTDIVLCVAGRGVLDEAAACLLAHLLEELPLKIAILPHASALKAIVPDADRPRIKIVCLSYLDREATAQARYLVRRFRQQIETQICVVGAFWGLETDGEALEQARIETRADRIAISLRGATEAVNNAQKGVMSPEADGEPELVDLAHQISSVIERTA